MPRLSAVLVLTLVALIGAPGLAIDLDAVGQWSPTIGVADLVGGAGTDLAPTYESSVSAVHLTVSNTAGDTDAWKIQIYCVGGTWDGRLVLSVQRTGGGSGSGADPVGGTAYVVAGGAPVDLFQGWGDRANIPLQLRLGGVGLAVPYAPYDGTLYLAVVDI